MQIFLGRGGGTRVLPKGLPGLFEVISELYSKAWFPYGCNFCDSLASVVELDPDSNSGDTFQTILGFTVKCISAPLNKVYDHNTITLCAQQVRFSLWRGGGVLENLP